MGPGDGRLDRPVGQLGGQRRPRCHSVHRPQYGTRGVTGDRVAALQLALVVVGAEQAPALAGPELLHLEALGRERGEPVGTGDEVHLAGPGRPSGSPGGRQGGDGQAGGVGVELAAHDGAQVPGTVTQSVAVAVELAAGARGDPALLGGQGLVGLEDPVTGHPGQRRAGVLDAPPVVEGDRVPAPGRTRSG